MVLPKKRGISNEQISVVVAYDRNGSIITKMAGRGRITANEIDQTIGECLDKEIVLCTDSATNYKSFAKKKGIAHEIINSNKGEYVKKGVYHIQHVNAYHRRLKKWMERCNRQDLLNNFRLIILNSFSLRKWSAGVSNGNYHHLIE